MIQRIEDYLDRYYSGKEIDPTFTTTHGDDTIQITIIKKHQDSENFDQWVESCPYCHQKISLRKVTFCTTMVTALKKAYETCIRKQTNKVSIGDIGLNEKEYARFNDLVRFWLAFKGWELTGGMYWFPLKRVWEFLEWNRSVAEHYLNDPTKKKGDPQKHIMSEKRISIQDVKWIHRLMQETNWFTSEYFKSPFRMVTV